MACHSSGGFLPRVDSRRSRGYAGAAIALDGLQQQAPTPLTVLDVRGDLLAAPGGVALVAEDLGHQKIDFAVDGADAAGQAVEFAAGLEDFLLALPVGLLPLSILGARDLTGNTFKLAGALGLSQWRLESFGFGLRIGSERHAIVDDVPIPHTPKISLIRSRSCSHSASR